MLRPSFRLRGRFRLLGRRLGRVLAGEGEEGKRGADSSFWCQTRDARALLLASYGLLHVRRR